MVTALPYRQSKTRIRRGPRPSTVIMRSRSAGQTAPWQQSPIFLGRFQHPVAGAERCCCDRGKAKRDRCRELLKALHLFRAPCVGRQQSRDLAEHRQCDARYRHASDRWRVRMSAVGTIAGREFGAFSDPDWIPPLGRFPKGAAHPA